MFGGRWDGGFVRGAQVRGLGSGGVGRERTHRTRRGLPRRTSANGYLAPALRLHIFRLNHTTTFQHEALGRRTARTLPDNSTETGVYSAVADPVDSSLQVLRKVVTDFRGRSLTNPLDRMDRVERVEPSTRDAATNDISQAERTTVTYEYTAAGRRGGWCKAAGSTGSGVTHALGAFF